MKTKFCFGCQFERPETEGEVVNRGRSGRWMCKKCIAKSIVSAYTSRKNQQLPDTTGEDDEREQ